MITYYSNYKMVETWFDSSVNSNILRKTYINGFLDISNSLIARDTLYVVGNTDICGDFYAQYPNESIPVSAIIGRGPTGPAGPAGSSGTADLNSDLNLNANLSVTGEVDINNEGTYNITYTVSDSSNNESTATRIVKVVDNTPPEITLSGDNPETITVNSILTGYFNTERITSLNAKKAKEQGVSEEEILKQMEASVPVKRIGDPAEYGYLVA